jgi:flagellar hook-basal body complex protein FliE
MVVSELDASRQYLPLVQQRTEGADTEYTPSVKFTDSLKELISDTNSLQKDSTELTEKMIKGEPVDLHDVMIAAEKAKTSFQLLLEMRNKFLDLYREVSRIQV